MNHGLELELRELRRAVEENTRALKALEARIVDAHRGLCQEIEIGCPAEVDFGAAVREALWGWEMAGEDDGDE